MKRIFILLIFTMLFKINYLEAQKFKYGYINAEKILAEMPEIMLANNEIEAYVKEINDYINLKTEEYKTKMADFQANEKSLSPLIRNDKQNELNKLSESLQQFQTEAQTTINNKKKELYKNAISKLKDAIKAVAKENGYRMVIDNSGGQLLYSEEEDNVEGLVRKKLGIKTQ